MVRASYTVNQKLKVLEALSLTNNKRATAKKFGVQPSQIRRWKLNKAKLLAKKLKNPKAKSVHSGMPAMHEAIESEVYDWLIEQRENGFAVSTADVITKATLIDSTFKNGDILKQEYWCRSFRERHELVFRRPTRIAQHHPDEAEQVKLQFATNVMTLVKTRDVQLAMLANMDETAVYFDTKCLYTIEKRRTKTVYIRTGQSNNQRATCRATPTRKKPVRHT